MPEESTPGSGLANKLSERDPPPLSRAEALACMRRVLDEFVIEGIHTSIPIHREIMRLPAFRDGHVDPTFIERTNYFGDRSQKQMK